ncbi:MAG: pentapeptide repeat-containing protein [Sphingobacteriia bacterium]|nr:pentapeptide repeat-containing protein [Sphingobacteriia bacterium]
MKNSNSEINIASIYNNKAANIIAHIEHYYTHAYYEETLYVPLDKKSESIDGENNSIEKIIESFFASSKSSLLLTGDSGSGKTFTLKQITAKFWRNYNKNDHIITLFISLSSIKKIDEIFKNHLESICNFEIEEQVLEILKSTYTWHFILDGYDEMTNAKGENLFKKNYFNGRSEGARIIKPFKNLKVITSARLQYLQTTNNYKQLFYPINSNDIEQPALYDEIVINQLSSSKISEYISEYIRSKGNQLTEPWNNLAQYITTLNRSSELNELASNPFMLSRLVEFIPQLAQSEQLENIDKYTLISKYVYCSFSKDSEKKCTALLSDSLEQKQFFFDMFFLFAKDLAKEMFIEKAENRQFQPGVNLIIYQEDRENPWYNFFNNLFESYSRQYPQKYSRNRDEKWQKESCLVTIEESPDPNDANKKLYKYSFRHKSILEFFVIEVIVDELLNAYSNFNQDFQLKYLDPNKLKQSILNQKILADDPDLLNGIASRLIYPGRLQNFNNNETKISDIRRVVTLLEQVVEASAVMEDISILSSNIATLLNYMNIDLKNKQWSKVKIPAADLRETDLTGIDLSHADLRGVKFDKSKLDNTNLSYSNLENSIFDNSLEGIIKYDENEIILRRILARNIGKYLIFVDKVQGNNKIYQILRIYDINLKKFQGNFEIPSNTYLDKSTNVFIIENTNKLIFINLDKFGFNNIKPTQYVIYDINNNKFKTITKSINYLSMREIYNEIDFEQIMKDERLIYRTNGSYNEENSLDNLINFNKNYYFYSLSDNLEHLIIVHKESHYYFSILQRFGQQGNLIQYRKIFSLERHTIRKIQNLNHSLIAITVDDYTVKKFKDSYISSPAILIINKFTGEIIINHDVGNTSFTSAEEYGLILFDKETKLMIGNQNYVKAYDLEHGTEINEYYIRDIFPYDYHNLNQYKKFEFKHFLNFNQLEADINNFKNAYTELYQDLYNPSNDNRLDLTERCRYILYYRMKQLKELRKILSTAFDKVDFLITSYIDDKTENLHDKIIERISEELSKIKQFTKFFHDTEYVILPHSSLETNNYEILSLGIFKYGTVNINISNSNLQLQYSSEFGESFSYEIITNDNFLHEMLHSFITKLKLIEDECNKLINEDYIKKSNESINCRNENFLPLMHRNYEIENYLEENNQLIVVPNDQKQNVVRAIPYCFTTNKFINQPIDWKISEIYGRHSYQTYKVQANGVIITNRYKDIIFKKLKKLGQQFAICENSRTSLYNTNFQSVLNVSRQDLLYFQSLRLNITGCQTISENNYFTNWTEVLRRERVSPPNVVPINQLNSPILGFNGQTVTLNDNNFQIVYALNEVNSKESLLILYHNNNNLKVIWFYVHGSRLCKTDLPIYLVANLIKGSKFSSSIVSFNNLKNLPHNKGPIPNNAILSSFIENTVTNLFNYNFQVPTNANCFESLICNIHSLISGNQNDIARNNLILNPLKDWFKNLKISKLDKPIDVKFIQKYLELINAINFRKLRNQDHTQVLSNYYRIKIPNDTLEPGNYIQSQILILPYINNIEVLDLSYNNLSDNTFEFLLNNLARFNNLKILLLNNNNITNSGLGRLIEKLRNINTCPNLEFISLAQNQIFCTHESINTLEICVNARNNLKYIDISMNFIMRGNENCPIENSLRNNIPHIAYNYTKYFDSNNYNNKNKFYLPNTKFISYKSNVYSLLRPTTLLTTDNAVSGLYVYRGLPTAQHASMLIEALSDYGQRYILKADLYCDPDTKEMFIKFRYFSPEELPDFKSRTGSKTVEISKSKLKELKSNILESQRTITAYTYSAIPTVSKNQHNCATWLKEMWVKLGLLQSAELNSFLIIKEVESKGGCIMM